MKYKFTTSPYGQKEFKMFGVEILDSSLDSLREISWDGWTTQEIQKIIDKSKALKGKEEFIYQVPESDLIILIRTDKVYFFDWHTEQELPDITWSFAEFIDFMEQFKKFIKENS